MKHSIVYNNQTIEFELEYKRIKNMNLHLNRNGDILVSAPNRLPIMYVEEFVSSKAPWILKNKEQILKKKEDLTSANYIMYLGKKKKLVLINSLKEYCKWDEDNLEVHLNDYDNFERILYKFLKSETKQILNKIYDEVYEEYMIDYDFEKPVMKIRKMTARYGSCQHKLGIITLNESLIHYDLEFIRYVIIHEFAHMIEPNHSRHFYSVVSKYMPNYKVVFERGAKFDL